MRRIAVWVVVLMCLTIVLSLGEPMARRMPSIEAATTRTPTPVEVTNFPAVQNVAGTINVGNLPPTQEVSGAVVVSNLPVDMDGNLRVSGSLAPAPRIRFVAYTEATFGEGTGALTLSRACDTEHPGSRLCDGIDLFRSIPPPPESAAGGALIMVEMERDVNLGRVQSIFSTCTSSAGVVFDCPSQPYPVACCGF